MKINELYNYIPTAYKDILKQINVNVINNLWTTKPGGVSEDQRSAISENIWVSILNRDVSITILNYCRLHNIDLENLTENETKQIYVMLFMHNADKWKRLWENIYLQEYNPIWNYDGSNTTTRTYEYGKTSTNTKDFTIEHAKDSSDTTTVTNSITDRDIYSFDGNSPVGSSKDTNNGESETVYSGSDTDTHSGTDTVADSGVDTERITETKGGNQGTTTTQYMELEELKLREEFNYFDILSKDIIEDLTMGIYN